MENFDLKYFLAANSCDGFVSFFSESYLTKSDWKGYIIKGGPGTGKSSFMKKLAEYGKEKGCSVELCPCSSDPDSLDAVIFYDIKSVVLDGTAPHVVDPKYPAVVDEILNFGEFWDSEKLESHTQEIITLTNKNKNLHKRASLYLQGIGSILSDNYNLLKGLILKEKAVDFALKLSEKYLPDKKKTGREDIRFLSGITPKGIVFFDDTVKLSCKNLIVIEDDFSFISNFILKIIRENALKKGYEIITVRNSFLTENIDHIIIPKLSLGFVTENNYMKIDTNVRRIHSRRFLNLEKLNYSKEKIKFNKKIIKELLQSAINTLKEAKEVHDDLEKYYVNAMDFKTLNDYKSEFAKRFFG